MHLWRLSTFCFPNLFGKSPAYKWIWFLKFVLSKFFGTEKILFFSQLNLKNKQKIHCTLWDFPLHCLCSYFPTCLEWVRILLIHRSPRQSVESRDHIIFICENYSVPMFSSPLGPPFPFICNKQNTPAGLRNPALGSRVLGFSGSRGTLVLVVAGPSLVCYSTLLHGFPLN